MAAYGKDQIVTLHLSLLDQTCKLAGIERLAGGVQHDLLRGGMSLPGIHPFRLHLGHEGGRVVTGPLDVIRRHRVGVGVLCLADIVKEDLQVYYAKPLLLIHFRLDDAHCSFHRHHRNFGGNLHFLAFAPKAFEVVESAGFGR